MYYVYILQSQKNKKFYIGSTNNIERRLLEHNSGKTKSISNITPLSLVFKKEFETLKEARAIETKLKRFKNRNIIETIVGQQELKMGL